MSNAPFPHCDSRVLHAPGKCQYCDLHPDLQKEREANNISFTGEPPQRGKFPCPAEQARSSTNLNAWHGNRAFPAGEPHPTDDLTAAVVKALTAMNPDDTKKPR